MQNKFYFEHLNYIRITIIQQRFIVSQMFLSKYSLRYDSDRHFQFKSIKNGFDNLN
jgi:hypothetical protein